MSSTWFSALYGQGCEQRQQPVHKMQQGWHKFLLFNNGECKKRKDYDERVGRVKIMCLSLLVWKIRWSTGWSSEVAVETGYSWSKNGRDQSRENHLEADSDELWEDKLRWVGNSGRRGVSEDFHKRCLRSQHKLTAYIEKTWILNWL